VVVALDLLKSSTSGSNVPSKRIILFSDLGCPANEDQLKTIKKAMVNERVEFVFM
jgi:protein-disulfide isomerase